ncbi:MAG: GAF domain-containing protein [Chloroflexi bacterium]|nr:GAF domain-containing protein [Chloroflexota bacterium]
MSTVRNAARGLLVLLTILAAAVIAGIVSTARLNEPSDVQRTILYGVLILFAYAIPVQLKSLRLSAGHVFVLVGLLSASSSGVDAMIVAAAVSTFLGTVLHLTLMQRRGVNALRDWPKLVAPFAGVVLSAYSFVTVFRQVAGVVPSAPVSAYPAENFGALVLSMLAFLAVYSGAYLLLRLDTLRPGEVLIRELPPIVVVLALPLPLAVLGGEIASKLGTTAELVFAYGAMLIVIALSGLGRAEQKLRDDLEVQQSLAVQNTVLMADQDSQISQMSLLNEVVATLSGTLSPDTLVDHIISCASVLTGATGYAVYLNWNDQYLLARAVGLSDVEFEAISVPLMSLQVDDSDRFDAHPLVVPDIARDPRAEMLRSVGVHRKQRSLIEFPLVAGGAVLGVLALYFTHTIDPNDRRLEILRAFTTQAAQSLYNARQYVEANEAFQRNAERLMTLAVLSRSLSSSVDVGSMCEQVLDEVLSATGAETGLLVLLDDIASTPQIGATRGIEDDQTQFASVIAALRQIDPASGAFVIRRDMHTVGMPPFLTQESNSLLIVPMVQASFLFGVIWLEHSSPSGFGAEDIRFVEQISNQAVIALENGRLFQRREADRERLARLLDTMVEGIMMIDRQGDVVLANPRMSIVGLASEDLLHANFLELLEVDGLLFAERVGFASREEAVAFVLHMDTYSEQHEATTYNVSLPSGSQRAVERRIVPVSSSDSASIGLMLVFYDRTAQQELERSREELTNMIIHDLRSPLTAVTTSQRLLYEMIPKDSPYWSVVESATGISRRAVKKILNRVDSLLDIAKMQSGGMLVERSSIDFGEIARSVIEELAPLAKELDIEVELIGDGNIPNINVDSDKIERVMLNFIDNALKYSPKHSLVSIHCFPHEPDNGFVRIEVRDQGLGIPEDYKSRLFDGFVQVEGRRSARGGVGLGLTFAKLTIEAHGGRVWIEDNPGGGSIFAFTLPTAPAQQRTTVSEQ